MWDASSRSNTTSCGILQLETPDREEMTVAKTKQVNKSAKTGRFVSSKQMKTTPGTTYKQTVPTGKKGGTKKK
jgi:hypothetical protein